MNRGIESTIPSKTRTAFTLVELLVVIAIIGILIGILLPAVQKVRAAARRTQCANRMRQVALAYLDYEALHKKYPRQNEFHHSMFVMLLPYMEQEALFEQVDLNTYPDDNITNSCPSFLKCPSDPVISQTLNYKSYYHNEPAYVTKVYPVHMTQATLRSSKEVETGTSNYPIFSEVRVRENGVGADEQILFGSHAHPDYYVSVREILQQYIEGVDGIPIGSPGFYPVVHGRVDWTFGVSGYNHLREPNGRCGRSNACLPGLLPSSSYHPGGVNTIFADGHTEFNADTVDRETWYLRGWPEVKRSYLDLEFNPRQRGAHPRVLTNGENYIRVRGDGQTVRVIIKKWNNRRWETVSISDSKTIIGTSDPFE